MKPSQYRVIGQGVLDYVDRLAPDEVYDEFYSLLESLMEIGPYPEDQPARNILSLQEASTPNGFTAAFDDGLLAYQVMRDQPIIKLVDAFWLPDDEDGPGGVDYAF